MLFRSHALLPDHIRKRLRPVFPVQRLIHPRSPPFCLVLYTIFTGKKRAGAKIAVLHPVTAKKPSPMRGSHWGALPFVGAGQTKQTSPQKDADQRIRSAPSVDGRYSTETSYKSNTSVSGGAYQDIRKVDRKSTRLNSSHASKSRMPSSA